MVLVIGAIIAKAIHGNHFGGTYGLIMPTYKDGTIDFENGTYRAQAYAEGNHSGFFQFSGHYTQVGDTLHLTFDSVTDDPSGLDKIKADLVKSDVDTMAYLKTADFLMKRGSDGRIELYSNGDNMGPKGELNMILVDGSADSLSNYSVVMNWPAPPPKEDPQSQTPDTVQASAPSTNKVIPTPATPALQQAQAPDQTASQQPADNSQPDQSQQDQSQQAQPAPDSSAAPATQQPDTQAPAPGQGPSSGQ